MKQINFKKIYDKINLNEYIKAKKYKTFMFHLTNNLLIEDLHFSFKTDVLDNDVFSVSVGIEDLDKFYFCLHNSIKEVYNNNLTIDEFLDIITSKN